MLTLLTDVSDPADLVELDGLKDYLHIDGDAEDNTLADMLAFVLAWWRKEGGNVPQTWSRSLPCFPTGKIALKKNVAAITAFDYADENGDPQQIDPEDQEVYRFFAPTDFEAFVEPVSTWPATTSDVRSDAVVITFVTSDMTGFDLGCVRQLMGLVTQNREGFSLPSGVERLFSHARGASYA